MILLPPSPSLPVWSPRSLAPLQKRRRTFKHSVHCVRSVLDTVTRVHGLPVRRSETRKPLRPRSKGASLYCWLTTHLVLVIWPGCIARQCPRHCISQHFHASHNLAIMPHVMHIQNIYLRYIRRVIRSYMDGYSEEMVWRATTSSPDEV